MDNTLVKGRWLDELLKELNWTPADLSRATGLDSAVISNIRNGKRGVGTSTATKIGKATNRPAEEILRLAGEIESTPPEDETLYRINHLYHTLREPSSKLRALEFFEFLAQQEEKSDRKSKKPKPPKP